MTQEEIQKQIEAVRGLIEMKKDLDDAVYYIENEELEEALEPFNDLLRTLTETLQPYLNGEKLEV